MGVDIMYAKPRDISATMDNLSKKCLFRMFFHQRGFILEKLSCDDMSQYAKIHRDSDLFMVVTLSECEPKTVKFCEKALCTQNNMRKQGFGDGASYCSLCSNEDDCEEPD